MTIIKKSSKFFFLFFVAGCANLPANIEDPVFGGSFPIGFGRCRNFEGMLAKNVRYTCLDVYKNGSKYYGEHLNEGERDLGILAYDNSVRDGFGIYEKYDGTIYVGQWKDDLRHGSGIWFNPAGARLEGTWREDAFFSDQKFELDKFVADKKLAAAASKIIDAQNKKNTLNDKIQDENKENKTDRNKNESQDSVVDVRKRYALVLGNSNYSSLPKLPNALNDAREITQSLKSAGFQVFTHENLDLAGMQNAIRVFGGQLGKNDVALVYYAGHGVQVKGKNYLIPVKENIKKSFEVPASAIDIDLVLATLENIKNDLNIVILDACRSPFPGEARGTNRGLATIEAAKGTFIAFATAPGKEALDGSGSNSPYTKHLSKLIGKKGLPLEQVFKEVRKAVVAETNGEQVPWENSSLMGDFYFQK
jgi:hypothetical protein